MKKPSASKINVLKIAGIVTWLGTLSIVGLTGCAGDRYHQSTGEYIDDKADSARVRKALAADTQYKYDGVNVEMFKGVAQLSGFVNSKDERNRAGDITKTVDGVKEVKNNLIVKAD
jgi:osmotically-inducible protein OsmY